MSFTALKKAILTEARQQASVIAHTASAQIDTEKQRTTNELRNMEEAIVAHARKEGQLQTRILHQQAELAGRARILLAKQEELEKTKKEFVRFLLFLDASAQKDLHKKLEAMLPKTKGTIIAGDTDEGGFIFKSKNVKINLTYKYLTDNIFWKYRAEIAKELFN